MWHRELAFPLFGGTFRHATAPAVTAATRLITRRSQVQILPPLPRNRSGIYRLLLTAPDGATALYIGETDELRRRSGNYRNPGPSQRTSLRINALLKNHLSESGTIAMAIATQATLEINGISGDLDLARKASRLLAENAALVQATLAGADRIENL